MNERTFTGSDVIGIKSAAAILSSSSKSTYLVGPCVLVQFRKSIEERKIIFVALVTQIPKKWRRALKKMGFICCWERFLLPRLFETACGHVGLGLTKSWKSSSDGLKKPWKQRESNFRSKK